MLRSMYSGVAGLKTHQTKMDVIGNNIANVNTTSFKSQSISFSDLMYQTTQRASGATETTGGVNARQIGLGAQSASIATAIETQGATQTTNNPYDLMISGDAFFIVNDGTQNVYTRDGSFYVDGNGNLATQSDGYYIMGWMAVTDEDTGVTSINTNGGLTKLQIMSDETSTFPPEGTSQAVVSGNIDAKDTNITSSAGKTIALEFYDNLGYLYTAEFTIKDVDDEKNTYTMTLTDIMDSDGKSVGAEQLANVHLGSDAQAGVTDQVPGVLKSGYYVSNYSASKGTADFAISDSDSTTTDTTMFSAVPTSGTLKDLDTAGVLKDLYNIVIDDVNFYAEDTYTMDNLGNLTISHTGTASTTTKKSVVSDTNTTSYTVVPYDDTKVTINYTTTVGTITADEEGGKYNSISSAIRTAYGLPSGIKNASSATYHTTDDDGIILTTAEITPHDFKSSSDYTIGFSGTKAYITKGSPTKKAISVSGTFSELVSSENGLAILKYYDGLDATSYTDATYSIDAETGTITIEYEDTTSSTGTATQTYELDSTSYKISTSRNTSTNMVTYIDATDVKTYEIDLTADFDKIKDNEDILAAFGITNPDTYNSSTAYGKKTQYTIKEGSPTTITITSFKDSEEYTLAENYSTKTSGTTVTVSYTTSENVDVKGKMTALSSTVKNAFGISSSDFDTSEPDDTYEIEPDSNGDYILTITDNSYKTIATEYNRNEMTLNYDHANGSYIGATFKQADGTENGIEYSTITTDKIILNFNPDMDDTVNPWTDVYLDLSTTTNFNSSGTSTLQASKGDLAGNNTGRMMGTMTGITISKDGKVSASYSNGQTLLLGQIASATFANASGLEKAGNNLYTATLNSGDPVVQDITVGGGSISTGVLEMSNVDLSNEFTNMITAQRGFQANSRIITVSDTLLEELTNLKR